MKNEPINVLWTGGWDSTYRMVELSRRNVTIQPIYCCDPGRQSLEKEKETIERIRKALKNRGGGYKRHFFTDSLYQHRRDTCQCKDYQCL